VHFHSFGRYAPFSRFEIYFLLSRTSKLLCSDECQHSEPQCQSGLRLASVLVQGHKEFRKLSAASLCGAVAWQQPSERLSDRRKDPAWPGLLKLRIEKFVRRLA
jgi:hypothetical protein